MTEDKRIKDNLRKTAFDLGFSLFGIADITGIRQEFNLDQKLAGEFDCAISLGKRLLDAVLEDIKDRPTALYFHHYRQINFFLDRGAFLLASYIQDSGFRALPIPASQVVNWKKQIAHVSHKKVGLTAGLGWIGRNNLLVNSGLGSRFRLVTILTDTPLEPDTPLQEDCGSCRACLPTCPAQAIKERNEDFDHLACFEKLKGFRDSGLVGQYICGICVKACPGFNVKK